MPKENSRTPLEEFEAITGELSLLVGRLKIAEAFLNQLIKEKEQHEKK